MSVSYHIVNISNIVQSIGVTSISLKARIDPDLRAEVQKWKEDS